MKNRYGDVALGVECAWPRVSGTLTAGRGASLTSSHSRTRGSVVGIATFVVATLLLGVALVAGAAPYAPQEYDFDGLQALDLSELGVVERVREVPRRGEPAGLHEAFEHSVNPETEDEVVVRLDDGRTITVLLGSAQRFRQGERVRLVGGRLLRS